MAEKVLARIHVRSARSRARSLRECLLIQMRAIHHRSRSQELALQILDECFDAFAHKHFAAMIRDLHTTDDALRAALDEIHKLNPKPGNTAFAAPEQTVIPDFLVEREDNELVITLNDSGSPRPLIPNTRRCWNKGAKRSRATRACSCAENSTPPSSSFPPCNNGGIR